MQLPAQVSGDLLGAAFVFLRADPHGVQVGPVEDDGVADRVGVADGSAELVDVGNLGAGGVADVSAGESA
ncbi:hypothetical protein [Streptomyces sp. NPDC007355]|uniref:hypothetical protein n=1 Tax=Streptomyces sp. NPDC007355 TaxID=3364778 RepID=UPI0036782970